MRPIRTEETNHDFGPPEGQEEHIGNLPCKWDTAAREEDEFTYIESVWKPSEAERAAIAAGQNVRLGVGWIGAFPPVRVGVTHLEEKHAEV